MIDASYIHFAFFTLAIKLFLAKLDTLLWTPLPPLRLESCIIKGVGTTS